LRSLEKSVLFSSMKNLTRVAWLQPIWSHYHIARAKAFQSNNSSVKLFCLEVSDFKGEVNGANWRVEKCLDVNRHVLFPGRSYSEVSSWEIAFKVANFIRNHNIEILCLLGYSRPEIIRLVLLIKIQNYLNISKSRKVNTILLSESKKDDFERDFWKERFKGVILKFYDSALVGGRQHKDYLVDLGMKSDSIFLGYDVVENSVFEPSAIRKLANPYPSKSFFLSINRFVDKKNLSFLIEAYAAYYSSALKINREPWHLILCGDGENKEKIEKQIRSYGLDDFIHLPGFLSQAKLLPYFAHAKCFIHASVQEQWGLVVNEAMASGLPVLVSNKCGCFEDLVREGINGFGFDPKDQAELTGLMLELSSGKISLPELGRASLKHIQKYSPDYFAAGLYKAIKHAFCKSGK